MGVPLTINMCIVLTNSSGGDEAAAIFNAAFGSLLGVFVSPMLILLYLGVQGAVDLFAVFYKLGLRVVLPIAIGQILRKYSKTVVEFVKTKNARFKKLQEYCLTFIVYTVFCKTFSGDINTSIWDFFIMIAFQFLLLSTMMSIAWFLLKMFFERHPKLRVMGLYGCTHKSVAMGVPLITAIYEEDPLVGFYTLPLLIWHPMQLLIGTFISPRLKKFVENEEERLKGIDDPVAVGPSLHI